MGKRYRAKSLSRGLRRSPDQNDSVNDNGVTNIDLAAIDLARILESCSPRDQNLLLQTMRGFTAGEIALQEHTTNTAVRIRLLRARRAARTQLNRTAHLKTSGVSHGRGDGVCQVVTFADPNDETVTLNGRSNLWYGSRDVLLVEDVSGMNF